MRAVLFAAALLPVATGCPTDPALLNRHAEKDEQRTGKPADPDRIEITFASSSGIYGGPTFASEWVLEKAGTCRGTVSHGTNAGPADSGSAKKYEVPAEVFDECQALLRETDFFRMRKRSEPEARFEDGSSSIRVKWNGREHDVLVIGAAKPPEGYGKLTKFVTELPGRGKEVTDEPRAVGP